MSLLSHQQRSDMMDRARRSADFCVQQSEADAAKNQQPFVIGPSFGICTQCGMQTEIILSFDQSENCPLEDECAGQSTVKHPCYIAENP